MPLPLTRSLKVTDLPEGIDFPALGASGVMPCLEAADADAGMRSATTSVGTALADMPQP
jgi:hypothetical protein